MAHNEPSPRRALRNDVFETLHQRVISGEIHPGQWLRQEEIASRLGVSMTPVREALDLLVASGLAERVPYRGVRVLELSREEILDAYGLRLLIEPLAAQLAASNASPAQAEELKRIHDRTLKLIRLADMSRLRALSRQFHALIVSMSGSPLLERLYQMVANQFPDWMLYEAMFHHPEQLQASLRGEQEQHNAILEAIALRDGQAAARATHDHLLSLGRDLQTYLDLPPELIQKKEQQFFSMAE